MQFEISVKTSPPKICVQVQTAVQWITADAAICVSGVGRLLAVPVQWGWNSSQTCRPVWCLRPSCSSPTGTPTCQLAIELKRPAHYSTVPAATTYSTHVVHIHLKRYK